MKILLVTATELEIAPLLAYRQANGERIGPHHIELLITGVGGINTCYALAKRLTKRDIDLVMQAGIAGIFDEGLPLGSTVLVKQDRFADMGAEEKGNFTDIFQMGLGDGDAFPFSDGWLVNEHSLLSKISLPLVKAVSVNRLSDETRLKDQLAELYQPGIESMEGAAFHYTCLRENIPFLQLRSISNIVGERDKSKWMIPEAIGDLNKKLFELVEKLNIE